LNREPLNFVIKEKEIYYTQRKFVGGNWLRCMPPPENFILKLKMSRNRFPSFLADLFKFTPEEIAEYNNAKTEQDLANIIIRDAKSKGCVLVGQSNQVSEDEVNKGVIV
jgi:hypothetical protein